MAHRLAVTLLLALALAGCRRELDHPWRPIDAPAVVPEPVPAEEGILTHDRMSSGCSRVTVSLAADLPFGGMCLVALALALLHRRRARAAAAIDPTAKLVDGPAVIVGTVETEGDAAAVMVRIAQTGSEYLSRSGWTHHWQETERMASARPFHVRRDDGIRVRVEPDDDVALHHDLHTIVHRSLTQRVRVAEINAGMRVQVSGELSGAGVLGRAQSAYREGAGEPQLRPPRTGKMVITTEASDDVENSRMRFHLLAAALLAVAWLIVSASVLYDYTPLRFDGRLVYAWPTAVSNWKVWVAPKGRSGQWVEEYAVRGVTEIRGRSVTLEDESGHAMYACAGAGRCATVPFVVAEHAPSIYQIGLAPTLHGIQHMVLCIIGVIGGLVYPLMAWASRPWYSRGRVDSQGRGRLTDPE